MRAALLTWAILLSCGGSSGHADLWSMHLERSGKLASAPCTAVLLHEDSASMTFALDSACGDGGPYTLILARVPMEGHGKSLGPPTAAMGQP